MKKRFNPITFVLMVAVFLLSGNTADKREAITVDPADAMKFKHFSYIDHQGTGLEVFSFLMPVDWKFEGGINWILDNPAMPATIPFRVYNTKGKDEFEAFANHCFFWTTSLQLLGMFPPWTKYFGSIVKLPVNAQTALKKIILPRERQNYPDFKIISQSRERKA